MQNVTVHLSQGMALGIATRLRANRPVVSTLIFAFLALVSSVLSPAISVAESSTSSSFTVHFRRVQGFAVIVPVFVNGSGPYDFMLDTGSTCTTVDPELAQALHLQTRGKARVETLVQSTPVLFAVARAVSIGPVVAPQIELLIRNLSGLRSLDPAIRGILGQNALSGVDYLLDNQHRTIEFDPAGDVLTGLEGERTPLSRLATPDSSDHFVLMVPAKLAEGNLRTTNLVLDSGTASLVLFSESPQPLRAGLQSTVRDDEGAWQPANLKSVQLRIGRKFWNLNAHAVAFQAPSRAIDGLLPTSICSLLYVSNRRGFVIFAPKRSRDPLRQAFASPAEINSPLLSNRQASVDESRTPGNLRQNP